MSETQDFNPRTFLADRRARLARFAAAAKEPAWPVQEKTGMTPRLERAAKAGEATVPAATPLPEPLPEPKSFRYWFRMEGEEPPEKYEPTIREIVLAVARKYDVSLIDMRGIYRCAPLVRARHIAFYLCRRLTAKSLPEIGRQFGGRDHATILNGVRRIEQLIARDPVAKADIGSLIAKLGGDEVAS